MIFFVFLIMAVSFGWGWIKYRSVISPLIIFNLLWGVVLLLQPYSSEFGVYPAGSETLTIVCVGIIGFDIGAVFLTARVHIGLLSEPCRYEIRPTVVRILITFSIFYLVYSAYTSIGLLASGAEFLDIRTEYYSDASLDYYIKYYISMPLQYVTLIAAFISLKEKNFDFFLLGAAILTILLQVLQSGGRYIILNAIYMLVVIVLFFKLHKKMTIKIKCLVGSILFLLVYGIIYLTGSRTTAYTSNMEWYEQIAHVFYTYFAGSVTYMDILLKLYPWIDSATYGINFFAGFISPAFSFLTFIKFLPYPEIFKMIGQYATVPVAIGSSVYYNAMPTMFMYFYMDFGLMGVFLESVLLGSISIKVFRKMVRQMDWLSIGQYLLISVLLLNSSERWFLYNPGFALTFVYLWFLCKKERRNKPSDSYSNSGI